MTTNKKLLAWVDEVAKLCEPDSIHWCDGSKKEYDSLCDLMVKSGSATRLDPAQMVAMELPDLPPMSLYSYHASAHPPGLHATRMLTMLPGLLHAALSPHTRK